MNKLLEIKNLTKNYNTLMGEIKALDNLSFNLYDKEFLCIIGSSGCGKSTLLNILANIETKTSGQINYNKKNLKMGYMLQEDCLLPWLSIIDNATLGLELNHQKTKENIAYTKELLTKYGLKDFINKYPHELSGGMKQRVACINCRHFTY